MYAHTLQQRVTGSEDPPPPPQGGSEVALIFREHLPNGVKYVKFVSADGLGEQIVETREENRSTLSAIIPCTSF